MKSTSFTQINFLYFPYLIITELLNSKNSEEVLNKYALYLLDYLDYSQVQADFKKQYQEAIDSNNPELLKILNKEEKLYFDFQQSLFKTLENFSKVLNNNFSSNNPSCSLKDTDQAFLEFLEKAYNNQEAHHIKLWYQSCEKEQTKNAYTTWSNLSSLYLSANEIKKLLVERKNLIQNISQNFKWLIEEVLQRKVNFHSFNFSEILDLATQEAISKDSNLDPIAFKAQIKQNLYYYFYCYIIAQKPLDRIIGYVDFFNGTFFVDDNVLSPRSDSESIVEQALLNAKKLLNSSSSLSKELKILDLGTGTGCLGISLAKALAENYPTLRIQLYLLDINLERNKVLEQNIKLNLKSFSQQIEVLTVLSNWFSAINNDENSEIKNLDVIISNPPYIDSEDEHLLELSDPIEALVSPEKGLKDLRIIIEEAPSYLKEGGILVVEHGFDQNEAVFKLFEQSNIKLKEANSPVLWQEIENIKDLPGRSRGKKAILKSNV